MSVFPTTFPFKFRLSIKTATDMPVVITRRNLFPEIFDSVTGALEGGADIRFSLDVSGLTPTPFEVVSFHKDPDINSCFCEFWVKTASSPNIYIWWGDPTATALPRTDPYGTEAVWTGNNHIAVWHCDWDGSSNLLDSTPNHLDLQPENNLNASNIGTGEFGGRCVTISDDSLTNTRFYHADDALLKPASISMIALIKPVLSDSSWRKWLHKGQDGFPYGTYMIQNGENTSVNKYIEVQIAKTTNYYKNSELGNPSEFYLIIGTYDNVSKFLNLFVDGVLHQSQYTDLDNLNYNTDGFALLGRGTYGLNSDPTPGSPIGSIEGVRLLDTVIDEPYAAVLNSMVFDADFLVPHAITERYWVSGSDSVWNSSPNWSLTTGGAGGVSVPGPTNISIFDGGGTFNCTIDTTVSVAGFQMLSGFTGRVNQNAYPITVGLYDASFMSGYFDGTRANITINSTVLINGATFTSTDKTMQLSGTVEMTPGSFNHNNGVVSVQNNNLEFSTAGARFFDLQFIGDSSYTQIDSSCYVDHTLWLTGGYLKNTDATIHSTGDMSCGHTFGRHGSPYRVPLFMDGSGAQKLFVSSGSILPTLVIDKTTSNYVTAYGEGPIAVDGNFELWDGTFSSNGLDIHVGNV